MHSRSVFCGLLLFSSFSSTSGFVVRNGWSFRRSIAPRSIGRIASCALCRTSVNRRIFSHPLNMQARSASCDASSFTVSKTGSRWSKFTKQIATVGPACSSSEMLEKLFLSGIDIFRLNFSHGEHSEKVAIVEKLRHIEAKHSWPIAILADLQGPKLRVATFGDGSAEIKDGQAFRFDLNVAEPGDSTRAPMPHPEIIHTLKQGDTLLVDDGKLRFTVTKKGADFVDCIADVGGKISNKKGVNTPSITLPISPLTPKDRVDLEAALAMGVDWVALSFVQRPEDMRELRTLVSARTAAGAPPPPGLMAKLEKPSALAQLPAIVRECDACMVARGDMGVEMPPEDVPLLTREILDACRAAGCPAVVATQMLESMTSSPVPTRAEASDVAVAALEGADSVMLSAETASGRFPQESADVQRRVLERAERAPYYFDHLSPRQAIGPAAPHEEYDAAASAAAGLAKGVGARALVVFTRTGAAALRLARARPAVPIVALTTSPAVARRLVLLWGVHPAVIAPADEGSAEAAMACAWRKAAEMGLCAAGGAKNEAIVVLARAVGAGLDPQAGPPNMIRVLRGGGGA